jgi:AraC-like DNA-binding protein
MIRIKNNKIILTKFPLQPDDRKISVLSKKWYGPDEYSRFYFFVSGKGELFIKDQDSTSIIPHTVLLLNRSLTYRFTKNNLKGLCLCCTDQALRDLSHNDDIFNKDTVNNFASNKDLLIMVSHLLRFEKKALYYSVTSENLHKLTDFYKFHNAKPNPIKDFIPLPYYVSAYTAFLLFQQVFQIRNKIRLVNEQIYKHIKDYIGKNYTANFNINDIMDGNTYTDYKMAKIFKQRHNMSIIDYRNELRIERSKLHLQQRVLSIAEIAQDCGFNDQNSFTKVFKRLNGKSPKQYQVEYCR